MKIVKFGAAASAKTDERELELLNAFAKTQLKVDEVYIFSVLLCDNEVDRDLERFPVETLKELGELFVGATGICDHEWRSENQVARIYRTELVTDPERLNSLRSYPAAKLDRSAEYVCISLKKGEIFSSGMGNYLGCRQTEKGVAELYGFKAAVSIAADIYVPASGIGAGRCVALADSLCSALENAPQDLKVLGFECGDAVFCSMLLRDAAQPMQRLRWLVLKEFNILPFSDEGRAVDDGELLRMAAQLVLDRRLSLADVNPSFSAEKFSEAMKHG